jgi:hypothetical protein
MAAVRRLFPTEVGRLRDLERRHFVLLGVDAAQRVDVDPSVAVGLPATEVVQRIRDHMRERGCG